MSNLLSKVCRIIEDDQYWSNATFTRQGLEAILASIKQHEPGIKKPKIFCFIKGRSNTDVNVVAIAEDGECLATHWSTSEGWAKHDIGINGNWQHDHYKKKYPEGFELVWLTVQECETKQVSGN